MHRHQSLQESLIKSSYTQTHWVQPEAALCFCRADPELWIHSVKFRAFLRHFPCDGRYNEAFITQHREGEGACVKKRPWCHSPRTLRLLLLSVSQPLSHHLLVLIEGKREKDERTSCDSCEGEHWDWEEKKGGLVNIWKFKLTNESEKLRWGWRVWVVRRKKDWRRRKKSEIKARDKYIGGEVNDLYKQD